MLKLKNCVQLAVAAMILAGTTKILCATTFANTPYIINKNGLATVPYGTEPYLLHTEGATEEPLAAPNLRFISKAIIDYPNGITQGIVQDSNNKVYAVILDTWIILPLTLPNGPTQTICSFAKPKKPYTLNQKAKNIISLITYFNPTKPSNVLQFFAVDDGLNMYSIANPIKSTNYTLTPLATTWSNWSSSAGLSQSQITLYTNTLQSLLPKTYYKLNLPASFTPTTIQNKAVIMATLIDRNNSTINLVLDANGNLYSSNNNLLTDLTLPGVALTQPTLTNLLQASDTYGPCFANNDASLTNFNSMVANYNNLLQKQALSWRIAVTTPSGQPTANVVAMVTLTDRDETSTSYLVDIKGNMLDAAGKTLTQNYTDWLNGQQAILDAKYGNAQRFVGDNNANGLATASTQIAKAIATYANNYVYSLSPMMPNNLTSAPILINSKLNPLLITGLSLNDRKNQTLISNLAIDTQGLLYSFNNNNYLPLATTALGTNLKVKAKNSAQLKLSELLTMTDQSGTCFASDDTTEKNFKALQTQYIQQQQSFWSISVTANNDVELSINNGIPLKSVAQIEVTGRMGQTYQLPTANGFIFPGIYLIDISGQVYYKNGTNFTPFSTIQSTSTNPQTSYITWLNNQLAKQNDPGYGGVACFANKANNPAIKTAVAQAQSLVNAARLKTNWTLTLNPPAISLASGIVAAFNLVNRGADNLIGTGYTPGTYFVGVSGMMHTSAGAMNVNYSTWLTNLAKQQTSFPDAPNVKLPAFASSLNDAFVNLKNQLDNAVQVTHAKINNSLVIGGYQP